ncbi:hypothetical protein [Vibrio phage vB_VmeM-Yong XC32]|nr:hypothetical protein [Vibrio phage vB_VmeM-Yong XC31]QAX96351.1 hypothetical protein [Vibrio phage vB_VmeM-Yong XC32]QAX96669.1 hypothetical protein [Vibrio phage vB_VmeM-Yong MS31]QAX96987.1 hypothetical protein [Vibrio phage vB_VmeM-Yong MS32]
MSTYQANIIQISYPNNKDLSNTRFLKFAVMAAMTNENVRNGIMDDDDAEFNFSLLAQQANDVFGFDEVLAGSRKESVAQLICGLGQKQPMFSHLDVSYFFRNSSAAGATNRLQFVTARNEILSAEELIGFAKEDGFELEGIHIREGQGDCLWAVNYYSVKGLDAGERVEKLEYNPFSKENFDEDKVNIFREEDHFTKD